MSDDPATRFRENVTEITATIVTGIWLVGLFTGQWWWLPFLLVGYIVIVPLIALLFGDESDREEWWEWESESEDELEDSSSDREQQPTGRPGPERGRAENNADALETLRDRYAAGELTDEQFERKLERLLETETLEDVERWRRDARAENRRNRDRSGSDGDRSDDDHRDDRDRNRDRDQDRDLEFET
ncbi:SHOCT domain-containing protein [Natrarchaeobius chitinivorans]|uniref:SHOCT domain-containing protein n=1 Tax=Natrarchaeobius chitinivorans TaxID=1679083 RepID=A0A3N6PI72_NATCH|nr:SHOCT domain-containing protein [Natrarchaeobius chitinivorans]RQG97915.1 SHOCT domain-containing protein [Natrarchaeobius chitinivorans]